MELGHGYQRLPDTVQEIQCFTIEVPGVEISFDVLRLPIPRGSCLRIHRYGIKGQDLRFSSGKIFIQTRVPFGEESLPNFSCGAGYRASGTFSALQHAMAPHGT